MIIVRRIVLIPFVLLLIFFSSVLWVMNLQILRPVFYGEALEKIDFYNSLTGPVLNQALNDAYTIPPDKLPGGFTDPAINSLGITNEELAKSIRRAVPPEWLQRSVETFLQALEDYLAEHNSYIKIDLDTDQEIKLVIKELKYILDTTDSYNLAYQKFVDPSLEHISNHQLPFGIEVSSTRLIQASRKVVPPDWIQHNLEEALDQVTPYFTGESDEFIVYIDISDRVAIASAEFKLLLSEENVGEILYQGVIEPAVKGLIPENAALPYGLFITDAEILEIMRDVAPPTWAEEQTEYAIDDVTDYIVGRSDSIDILIDIKANKLAAQENIEKSINDYMVNELSLPTCTSEQQSSLINVQNYQDFPLCIPYDAAVSSKIQSKISADIKTLVFDPIPDIINMDEQVIRARLMEYGGEGSINMLDNIRKLMSEGFTYTEKNFEADISSSNLLSIETIDQVRLFIRDGWEGDQKTLDSKLFGTEGATVIQNVRSVFHEIKNYGWTIYVVILFLLTLIGILGGQNLKQRLLWGLGALVVCALLALIIYGPIYSAYVGQLTDKISFSLGSEFIQSDYFAETNNLLTEIGIDYWKQVLSDFQRNLLLGPAIMFCVGSVLIIIVMYWGKVKNILGTFDN